MKKKIIFIGLLLLLITYAIFGIISYADDGKIYVNLTEGNLNNIGYAIGNPKYSGAVKIWYLKTYNSTDETSVSIKERNLYCIKANYGDTWNTSNQDIVTYNLEYDLQAQREEILNKLVTGNAANTIVKDLLNPNKESYRQLLWILDNSYIAGQTDKAEYLAKIGIVKNTKYNIYEYNPIEGYDYTNLTTNVEGEYSYLLTDDDINAIQKAVIWYYTNYKLDGDTTFNKKDNIDWLTITSDNGENYSILSDLNKFTSTEGKDREEQARILYNYLIDAAENNKGQYTAGNNYTLPTNSVNVNTEGLIKDSNNIYKIGAQIIDGNIITGPIKINKNNNGEYEIALKVTDTNGEEITSSNYEFTDSTGAKLQNTALEDLVGRTEGFYIKVNTKITEQVNIKIDITTEKTEKKLWLSGTETTEKITLNPEQPVVEVTRTKETKTVQFVTNIIRTEKIFDLALRKYIVKINNTELSQLQLPQRTPTITNTTYKHRKDPVSVEVGDIVTYNITVYNEGDKAGYASQVIDQLPAGLIYNSANSVVSKDTTGADKNTYTVRYDTSLNQVIFNIVNTEENPAKELKAYENGNLDYETIEIKCKVVGQPKADSNNILTNVAYISAAFDTVDNTVGVDIDSKPEVSPNVSKDNMDNYTGNTRNKEDLTDSNYFYKGEEDDDDFEKIYVKTFDLSLRKFLTQVQDNKITGREPVVDVSPLVDKTGTTAIYKHSKKPIDVKVGDTVIYTIRVYNEGEISGFASEVKDYLPPHLQFAENSAINTRYGWAISKDGRIATTTYLSDKEISKFNGTELDYEDIQIECKILSNVKTSEKITNIAEISGYKYGDTVLTDDIDSKSDSMKDIIPTDDKLPDYKVEEENKEYVPGNEDDDDFEKVFVKQFDLSLRKFITQVQNTEVTSRVPQVKIQNGKITYEHAKDPLIVHVGDRIIYTLRIYNEGQINGYASEISDDIPEYLEYLPEDTTNVDYMWKMYDENGNETEKLEDAVKVKTQYLSKDNNKDNLLEAFDGSEVSYKDIKIAFKVKDPNSNEYIITNHAQISDDTDEDGKVIKDQDSETDKWNEGEDDQDIENVKVQYFDLALLKYVTKVIVVEDGVEKITETGYNGLENPEPVVKVELHRKKLQNVVVKFAYGIKIANEGDIAGYAKEITDYIPQGLKFVAEDNPAWKDEGNSVISTKQLEETLLQPGESATVEVILTWINGEDNLMEKINTAEISIDENEYGVPDKDSTPDNKKDGEDDIDIAKVILAISTGAAKTYFTLAIGLLLILAVGIFLIKRFVI